MIATVDAVISVYSIICGQAHIDLSDCKSFLKLGLIMREIISTAELAFVASRASSRGAGTGPRQAVLWQE